MTNSSPEEALDLLESRMQSTFGMGHDDFDRKRSRGPASIAYLNMAARIVDTSGVVPQLEEWRALKVKSAAGRKADIPFRAILILFLLHVQTGHGVNYNAIARTLDVRFRAKHFDLLGINDNPGDRMDWYKRLWSNVDRMMKYIDPFPSPRNKKLNQKQYAKLMAKANSEKGLKNAEVKLKRLDWVCEQLLHTSVRMLPKEFLDRSHGNGAMDATLIETTGRPNPKDLTRTRGNADPFSGRYRRQGSHDGQGAKTDKAGYEFETLVLVWNKPFESLLFPSLITAVGFHRPGELRGHGLKLIQSHQRLGFAGALVLCDRAYNNGDVNDFHIPLRLLGCELVIDYKKTNLGLQSSHEDLILVEGNWYVTWMPEDLIGATISYRTRVKDPDTGKTKRLIDKAKYLSLLAARRAYRLTPKGKPDKDGYQRFIYPTPGYMAVDRATGKRVAKPKTAATITIPIDAGLSKGRSSKAQALAIKHWQKFAYKSPEHKAIYGMRSLVESSNKTLKGKNQEKLGHTESRSGRGFAFNYLVATLAAVSSNLRKIHDFFAKLAERDLGGPIPRQRRRKTAAGVPLTPVSSPAALAPPR
ncbi:MAG: hypothetical protein JWM49_2497 [Microbacteriaceae bacterium]|nr:hypothetical protein [Microbacteriaceae bacterium]